MRTVWKWNLNQMQPVTTLEVPRGTKFVAAGEDPDGAVAIWGELDPTVVGRAQRDVYVIDTGEDVPDGASYVASMLSLSQLFMWHIYAGPERQ